MSSSKSSSKGPSSSQWPLATQHDEITPIAEERSDLTDITPSLSVHRPKGNSANAASPETGRGHTNPTAPQSKNIALAMNPLVDMSYEEVVADADTFVTSHNLGEYRETFRKGALAAKVQNTHDGFERLEALNEEDKAMLRYEQKHKWSASNWTLYALCALCAGCAIVQGADQTVINGAQKFYFDEFGIEDPLMKGLINGAPYAAASLLGCWLNAPLNHYFGRRGTIAIGCVVACLTAVWQASAQTWELLLAARFTLGIAVGAKSATTPIYAAECAPKSIRGALVMMWQMFTAFGIMLGFIISIAFQHLDFMGEYSQWRWMIGVTAIPPLIVGSCVYAMPESPRWYMNKGKYGDAFKSLKKLRKNPILAARDMYLAYKFLEAENDSQRGNKTAWGTFKQFFTVRRNRRAAQSAWFCMFMQQFCGVNIIAYYSTEIFRDAGYSLSKALLVSFGTGACNFLGAIPAIFSIDKFGRRNLLISTFPIMAILLTWTSYSFTMPETQTRLILITVSIYLFMIVYSPGMGPVPFTYSAEAFPLHIRAVGMASATSITWAFNFLISFLWPKMVEKFTISGGFAWYAAWNVFGFVFAYFLIPETKNKTLEELDWVFSMRNRDHVAYYAKKLAYVCKTLVGIEAEPVPRLYERDEQTEK